MSQDRVILQNTGHPDHLMTNPDHLTSPLTGHLTSPLTGHLTNLPMSHLTNHPMSHLTGHPTGPDPLMSPDHTDHIIDRKDFSFHLPVVSGMLMVVAFHMVASCH